MNRHRVPVMFLLLACALPAQAAAQLAVPNAPAAVRHVAASLGEWVEPTTARLALGGAAGLAAGAAAGGAAGWLLYQAACTGYCEIGGAVAAAGAALGGTLGIPLGVHLTNDRRGRFGAALFAAVAVAAAGAGTLYVLSNAIDSDAVVNATYVAGAVAVPALQIGVSVAVERRTAR